MPTYPIDYQFLSHNTRDLRPENEKQPVAIAYMGADGLTKLLTLERFSGCCSVTAATVILRHHEGPTSFPLMGKILRSTS